MATPITGHLVVEQDHHSPLFTSRLHAVNGCTHHQVIVAEEKEEGGKLRAQVECM